MENELHLTDLIDVEMLQRIQDAFSDMTGIASVTTDADGVAVTKGSHFSDFCMKYTRSSPLGCQRCELCDKNGAELALKKGASSTYLSRRTRGFCRTDYCGRQNGRLFYRRSGADRAAGYFKNHAGRR